MEMRADLPDTPAEMPRERESLDAQVAPAPAIVSPDVPTRGVLVNFQALLGELRCLLNGLVALVLIIVGLPLFAGIAFLILVVDGRPVLHRGKRLGIHRRPYTMYKFRTLARGASSVIGADLLSLKHRVMIPCGMFLRDTRLDELPQLFNILKGDMNFVGPRPERPEVYENHCKHLEGYERRFSVKPGLVGFSQLFTPHSSPKRLRTLADNHVIRSASRPFRDPLFVACALVTVTETVVRRLLRYAWTDILQTRILRLHRNRRELTRIRPRNARVLIEVDGGRTVEAPVVDINEAALLLECPERLAEGSTPLQLRIEVRFRRRLLSSGIRHRVARCTGQISHTRTATGGWRHVVVYDPLTEWDQYLVDQYLLRGSLANPFRLRDPEVDKNPGGRYS